MWVTKSAISTCYNFFPRKLLETLNVPTTTLDVIRGTVKHYM